LGLDGEDSGPPPPVDLEKEQRNADFVRDLVERGLVNAVHDVSDGGIACAAAEMALASGVGFGLDIDNSNPNSSSSVSALLFGEGVGRFVAAVSEKQHQEISKLGTEQGVFVSGAGSASGWIDNSAAIQIGDDRSGKNLVTFPLARLREAHEGWLPSYMSKVD